MFSAVGAQILSVWDSIRQSGSWLSAKSPAKFSDLRKQITEQRLFHYIRLHQDRRLLELLPGGSIEKGRAMLEQNRLLQPDRVKHMTDFQTVRTRSGLAFLDFTLLEKYW